MREQAVRSRLAVLAAFCVAACPFVAAAIGLAVRTVPIDIGGDHALIELAVLDAMRGERLLGPYSRFGWFHPGPAMFYLLLPAYAALGTAGLAWGTLLLNAGVAAATVEVMRRVAGPIGAVACGAVVGALGAALGGAVTTSPWNPFLVVLPAVLLAVLAAACLLGRGWALAAGAAVGTFLVQTHVGLAPLVAALGLLAALGYARAAGAGRRRWRALGGALAVGTVCWLPTIVDQVAGTQNVAALLRFASRPGGGQPWTATLGGYVTGASVVPLGPPAFTGVDLDGVRVAVAALSLATTLATLVLAARRGWPQPRALAVVAVVSTAAGVVAATRVTGPVLGYLVLWMVAGSAAGWTAFLLAVGRRVPAAVLTVGVAVAAVGLAVGGRDAGGTEWESMRDLAPQIVAAVEEREASRVHVRIADGGPWAIATGVAAALERRGVAVQVDRGWVPVFGPTRRADGRAHVQVTIARTDDGQTPPEAIVAGTAAAWLTTPADLAATSRPGSPSDRAPSGAP